MTSCYYNEFDPYAAQWLRNLILAGHLPRGDVDERSITEVSPDDLRGYTQCHFFAGIGGWPLALRMAGWDDARPVWTGSCPCQPFSSNGRRQGESDPRHLWPTFRTIIGECAPPTVFGEQVASADGRQWLAGVRADLEALDYAVGAADLCAAGVKAPHIRQRLWWVASYWTPDAPDRLHHASGPQRNVGHLENRDWQDVEWIEAADRRQWRIKPGLPLLAHGLPRRVGRLRAYGNAIVPQVAAAFIAAFDEARRRAP